jgi:DNA polymerase
MLVGEQPGDEEDRLGAPFVGPAGRLLDKALAAVGLDRGEVFITNAVKHFKWEPRGKRRLHKKPKAHEVAACRYWLAQEIGRVQPRVIVALGTTALYALTGSSITLTAAREQSLVHESGARIVATFHPSAVLRARDEDRETFFEQLCRELRAAVRLAAKGAD